VRFVTARKSQCCESPFHFGFDSSLHSLNTGMDRKVILLVVSPFSGETIDINTLSVFVLRFLLLHALCRSHITAYESEKEFLY